MNLWHGASILPGGLALLGDLLVAAVANNLYAGIQLNGFASRGEGRLVGEDAMDLLVEEVRAQRLDGHTQWVMHRELFALVHLGHQRIVSGGVVDKDGVED